MRTVLADRCNRVGASNNRIYEFGIQPVTCRLLVCQDSTDNT